MIGYFKIVSFEEGKDGAGAHVKASVQSVMDSGIEGTLYLPPYLRATQCEIKAGSVVFGVLDDTSGIGAALFGEDCDYTYTINADLQIKKKLTVDGDAAFKAKLDATGDVTSKADVKAGAISLKQHIHTIIPQTGTKTSSADGTIPPS